MAGAADRAVTAARDNAAFHRLEKERASYNAGRTEDSRPSLDEPIDAVAGVAPPAPAKTVSKERYSEAYIGLLSNNAFYQFVQSLSSFEEGTSDEAKSVMSMRQNWYWKQKAAYGTSNKGEAGPQQQEALSVFAEQTGGTEGKIKVRGSGSAPNHFVPWTDDDAKKLYSLLLNDGAIDEEGRIIPTDSKFTDPNGYKVRLVQRVYSTGGGNTGTAPYIEIAFDDHETQVTAKPPAESSFVWHSEPEKNVAVNANNWVRLFKGLQSFPSEWNLATYNSWLPMAVGLVGNMDNNGYITSNPARSYGDTNLAFAAELVRYHYNDIGGGEGGDTYSSYQKNLLDRAERLLGQGGWGGKFTDDEDPQFDYATATMDDLGTDPTKLGSMANAYNRMVAENFTVIANDLQWGGINISGEKGISPATLREYIDQMKTRVAGEGSSGYINSVIEEVETCYNKWYKYKTGVNNIYAVARRLEGEDWADFIIAYCGAESEESIKELWPWWEPKSVMEQKLNKAQDMKDFYDSMREQKQDMRDAGYVDIPNRGNTREEDEDEKQTGGAGRGGVGVSWGAPQKEEREHPDANW